MTIKKIRTSFSLSSDAITMIMEMTKEMIKTTGSGSQTAVIERAVRELYQREIEKSPREANNAKH